MMKIILDGEILLLVPARVDKLNEGDAHRCGLTTPHKYISSHIAGKFCKSFFNQKIMSFGNNYFCPCYHNSSWFQVVLPS